MTRFIQRTPAILGALLLLSGGLSAPATAQEERGRIVGKVVDAENGRPVQGVQVYIAGVQRGTLTGNDGRYLVLDVPAGAHDVTAEMLGYGTKVVTGVEVGAGKTTRLNVTLESAAVSLDEIVVSAARERGSSAFLMDERRTSASMVDAVGEMEMARRPDSDAAAVAQRMTGVTVSEGKYVYIRGLGERYSQTELNGSSLPSPEPEREVVPLDLFPSEFLESLSTQKSYTPDRPGDFSGGSVQIRTKNFPDAFTFQIGVGSSFNTESQFESGFLHYAGGGTDYLGFDDGSRDMPEQVGSMIGGLRGEPLATDPGSKIAAGRAFARELGTFTPTLKDTPLNRSLDLTLGGTTDVGEDRLGFMIAGTYSDSYTIRDRETEKKFRVSAFDPSVVGPDGSDAVGNVDYDFSRATRSIHWGGLGTLSWQLAPAHEISFRTTVNVSTDDESRRFEGWNREDIGAYIAADRLRYVSRKLYWSQLSGDHRLFAESRLQWRATVGRARRDEPGLREAIYAADGPDGDFRLANDGESGRYFFSDLTDDDVGGSADWSFPFELGAGEGSLKLGGAYRTRERDFAARRFSWRFLGGIHSSLDEALTGAEITTTPRRPNEFSLDEVVEPGDLYQASDERAASYLMAEVPVAESLRAVGGLRYEQYDLGMDSRGRDLAAIDQGSWIPSVNLIWSVDESMKVRGAFSRTVDRPEFRELAPFQFTEATSLRQVYGNPDLDPATIRNFDLRWDWFLAPGEIVSVGAYHKRIQDPIEQVFIATAGTAYSYQNGGEARVSGVELDTQLRLGRLVDALESVSTSLNLSLIDSEVDVQQTGAFVPTNQLRPLEGQASYVLNAGVNWIEPTSGVEAGIFYNRLGPRLTAAGGSGIPDIFEQPRNQMDATVKLGLPYGGTVSFKGENLMDAPFRFEQSKNGITLTQREYWVGRTFSVGLSWRLF